MAPCPIFQGPKSIKCRIVNPPILARSSMLFFIHWSQLLLRTRSESRITFFLPFRFCLFEKIRRSEAQAKGKSKRTFGRIGRRGRRTFVCVFKVTWKKYLQKWQRTIISDLHTAALNTRKSPPISPWIAAFAPHIMVPANRGCDLPLRRRSWIFQIPLDPNTGKMFALCVFHQSQMASLTEFDRYRINNVVWLNRANMFLYIFLNI